MMPKFTPTTRPKGRPPGPVPVIRVTMSLDQPTLDGLAAWQEVLGTASLSDTVRAIGKMPPRPWKGARKKS